MAKKQQAPRSRSGSRQDFRPPTTRRQELLAALEQIQQHLAERRATIAGVPARGRKRQDLDRAARKMPLVYTIQSCGQKGLLNDMAEGRVEPITSTLVEAIISEIRG